MKPLKYAAVFLFLIATAAVFAAGSEPDPVAPEGAGTADASEPAVERTAPAGVADLEVNKAELEESLLHGEPVAPVRREPVASPLMTAIEAVMQDGRDRISVLRADLERTHDPEAALVIQRRVEDVKMETELTILRLQADDARARGDEELARSIDESILFLTTPRPQAVPVDRPAPDAGRR